MDFSRPVSAIIPGATGRLLEVLGQIPTELNMTSLAHLAGVSVAQASRVLPRLVELGLVDRRDVPPASLFALNREHVGAFVIDSLLSAFDSVLSQAREFARSIEPRPVSITVFGSAARGEATARSDIDVLVVRRNDVAEDDLTWIDTTADWVLSLEALTGNRISVLEISEAEFPELIRSGSSLWKTVADEGIPIVGPALDDIGSSR